MSAPRLLWIDKTGQPVVTTTANGERNARHWGWTPAQAIPSVVPEAVEAVIFEADDECVLEVHEVRSLALRLLARFTITPKEDR